MKDPKTREMTQAPDGTSGARAIPMRRSLLGLFATVTLALPAASARAQSPFDQPAPNGQPTATATEPPSATATATATSTATSTSIPTSVDQPAAPPPAAPELRDRFELVARFGYGRAIGGTETGNTFQVPAHLPIAVEAGFRSSPRVSLLFGLQYAPLFRSGCIDNRDCTGRELKGTGTLVYHFKPGASFEPWFAYGVGYEVIQLNGPLQKETRKAIEILNAQFGVDWLLSSATSADPVRLGPFIGLTADFGLENRAGMHNWAVIGVRGTIDL